MIIPLHLVPDQQREQALHFSLDGLAVDPALRPRQSAWVELDSPIVGPVDAADLQRFHAMMYHHGLALQPTRMVYDRAYAFERLATAFHSGNDSLRDLAIDLFAEFQQAGEWIGLAH